jgi:hypothetical protein
MLLVLENILSIHPNKSTKNQFGLIRPTLDSSLLIKMENILLQVSTTWTVLYHKPPQQSNGSAHSTLPSTPTSTSQALFGHNITSQSQMVHKWQFNCPFLILKIHSF